MSSRIKFINVSSTIDIFNQDHDSVTENKHDLMNEDEQLEF